MVSVNNLKECPYCESEEYFFLYYSRSYKSNNFKFNKRFDGNSSENAPIPSGLKRRTVSAFVYCSGCERPIGFIEREDKND